MRQFHLIKKTFVALVCSMQIFAVSSATYSGGTGTAVDPYLISSNMDLSTLVATSADWEKHFKLTADLDMAGVTFNPIGNNLTPFTGSFDGNNMVVKNLTITPSASQNSLGAGFFGRIQISTVQNLGLVNLNINVKTTHERVGGIAGITEWDGCRIENCFVLGGSIAGQGRVGGITGYVNGNSTIVDCFVQANVSDAWGTVGGIVGNTASWAATASIINVAFYGEMGNGNAIIGSKEGGTVTNAYFIQKTGKNSDTNGSELTSAQLLLESNYTGFNYTTTWQILANNFAVLKSFPNTAYTGLSTSTPYVKSDYKESNIFVQNSKIYFPANISEVEIYDSRGILVNQTQKQVSEINVAEFQKGFFIVRAHASNGEKLVSKIVIR